MSDDRTPQPLAGRPGTVPEARTLPDGDVTVLFYHFPDGTVGALAYGLTGFGKNIEEALRDLEDQLARRARP